MTRLNLEEAINLLSSQPQQFNSIKALTGLAAQVKTEAVGNVTILFSGESVNGTQLEEMILSM